MREDFVEHRRRVAVVRAAVEAGRAVQPYVTTDYDGGTVHRTRPVRMADPSIAVKRPDDVMILYPDDFDDCPAVTHYYETVYLKTKGGAYKLHVPEDVMIALFGETSFGKATVAEAQASGEQKALREKAQDR